jgi:hypothetical protein
MSAISLPVKDLFSQDWRAELSARFDSGTVDLAEVMAAAGLTPRERHVVEQRLQGRSYAEIAADGTVRKPDGQPYPRQRMKQLEQDALVRLGLPQDFALASMHGHARQLVRLIEEGAPAHDDWGRVRAVRNRALRRLTVREEIEADMDRLTTRFLKESEHAGPDGLPDERQRHFESEATRLAERLAGLA